MTTDYDFPPEWPSMSPAERDRWFHTERARRQAMRQRTPTARHLDRARRRRDRRAAARSDTVDVEDHR
jgi:hypothetical protein